MKPIKVFLFVTYLILLVVIVGGCTDRNMPPKLSYSFKITDINGVNLVGFRYNPDSIKYYSLYNNFNSIDTIYNYITTKVVQTSPITSEYIFSGSMTTDFDKNYQLRYNATERDTIRVVYGKDNINVYKNSNLIFSKNNLSQTEPILFNIIK